jgi:hypothetical protein
MLKSLAHAKNPNDAIEPRHIPEFRMPRMSEIKVQGFKGSGFQRFRVSKVQGFR